MSHFDDASARCQLPNKREIFGIPVAFSALLALALLCEFNKAKISLFLYWNGPMFYAMGQTIIGGLVVCMGVLLVKDKKAKVKYLIGVGLLTMAATILWGMQHYRPLPQNPIIELTTFNGLPESYGRRPELRFHRLRIINPNKFPIENLVSRIQLPEPIVQTLSDIDRSITWRPTVVRMLVSGEAHRLKDGLTIGGKTTVTIERRKIDFSPSWYDGQLGYSFGIGETTGVWELSADKILPNGGRIEIEFLTSNTEDATNYVQYVNRSHLQSTNHIAFYYEGKINPVAGEERLTNMFFVPILFDKESRAYSSQPVQKNAGKWKPKILSFE